MKNAIFAATALLCGCVDAFTQLNTELPTFVGQNVRAVVQRIGYPDDQREIMGDTLFTWSTNHHSTMYLPTTTTTTGNVGGTPYYATTTGGSQAIPMNFHCMIRIAVNNDGIVKNTQWSGNRGGCAVYARALAR